jgi:hypothetical protein
MNNTKENYKRLSATKDALYITIATVCLAALVFGTQLFMRSAVKRDPSTQSFHLIGFGCIWYAAMGFLLVSVLAAWFKYFTVPQEERNGANLFLRGTTLYLLIITTGFLAIEGSLFIYSVLFR